MTAFAKQPAPAAQAALKILEEAWAYFTPQPQPVKAAADDQTDLFQYHNAA